MSPSRQPGPDLGPIGRPARSVRRLSVPGLVVRMCVTYRAIRTDNNLGDCDGVSVILDGVSIADPSYIYTSISLRDIERVEMLSPGQAGVLYGMRQGQSVLLVETKGSRAASQRD